MTATAAIAPRAEHSTVREGLVAGAIGATVVAIWFLVLDLIGSRLFYTPTVLGEAVARLLGVGPVGAVAAFLGYTVLHYLAFGLLGIVAAAIVHRSRAEPTILAAALLVFVVAEAGFYLFMVALNAGELFGPFGWWQITGANLLGSALIAWWLWRSHPGLRGAFRRGLTGGE